MINVVRGAERELQRQKLRTQIVCLVLRSTTFGTKPETFEFLCLTLKKGSKSTDAARLAVIPEDATQSRLVTARK